MGEIVDNIARLSSRVTLLLVLGPFAAGCQQDVGLGTSSLALLTSANGSVYPGLRHTCIKSPQRDVEYPNPTLHTLWCSGTNTYGQLGDGTTTHRILPVNVPYPFQDTTPGWETISVGLEHTCGLGYDGLLWCWGRNTYGQLGDGT